MSIFSSTARAIRSGATRLLVGAIADGQVLTRSGTTIVGAAAGPADADVVHDTGNETIAGVKTFTSDPLIPDEAYGAGWNGSLEPPTKNAVYDKIETLGAGYLAYMATLTQTSTNAPVATVHINTTGVTFTWARTAEGVYTITADSGTPFAANKTLPTISMNKSWAGAVAYVFSAVRTSTTIITVNTGYQTGAGGDSQLSDGNLTETPFEILIFP